MPHTLLRFLATQTLPAMVVGEQGVAAVEALVKDGHVRAVLPLSRSAGTEVPRATVTEFTHRGRRALQGFRLARGADDSSDDASPGRS